MLLWIILFSIAGSFLSMAGGIVLLWKEQIARKFSLFLISFSAGVLLGVAFLDLLPEALEEIGDIEKVSVAAVSAIVIFFTLERFLWWYHHHRIHSEEHASELDHPEEGAITAKAYLLLTGDAIHNFVDGVLIAAAFLADFSLGIGVAVGVIAHELPQEIADFGVMLHAGFSKIRILTLNFIAASTTFLGAIITFFIAPAIEGLTPFVIAFAIGIFVYIALSDLIPEIHHRSEHKYDLAHLALFIGGIVLIGWVV
ncbi:MAG: ZIP family metal transporter [Candidatus Spechtbacterales bacterium]